jgi:methyltransferase (TIGR00027 family)
LRDEQPSRTALLIALSLVLLHYDPKQSGAVSDTAADLCARVLERCSAQTRFLAAIARQGWFRAVARLMERITIPGILLHYALRKRSIAQLARAALENGATQVVVIGAGFDPLTFELRREFSAAQFWEIDHPATQRCKLRAFPKIDNDRLHFLPNDLSITALDRNALIESGFSPTQRTFWIAEGLLMYLRAEIVASLVATLRDLSGPMSQFGFTFMERHGDGRIRFKQQSKLVDWWLGKRSEPFVWGIDRGGIPEFIHPWRTVRIFDDVDLRSLNSLPSDIPLAAGELICLAENS